MRSFPCLPIPTLWLAALALSACSSTGLSGDYATAATDASTSWGDDDDIDWNGDDDDDSTTEPPEQEADQLALPPAQTEKYVFVANPDRDTVTRINVRSQEVDTTAVGNGPDLVLTTPDYTAAVVHNRGEDTVSLIEAASLDQRVVPVRQDLNQMVMSPDGAWVVLFHDIARERPDDPIPQGLQSFNEISLIHTVTGEHFPMAVGFNPRMVRYTADSTRALVVSDAYLAVIDLLDDQPLPDLIELSPDVIDPPEAEEVVVSGTGAFAFVRQFGTDEVLVVDLDAETVDAIPVGLNPTDLDLSPDGLQAVVVARGSRELWRLRADDPFAPADVLPFPDDLPMGSLLFDPTGDQAVLYTTASALDRFMTWDLSDDTIRTRALVKPVTGMAITPTGESMLAFHTFADAPDADLSPFSGSWALSIFSLEDFRSNPLKLPGEPIGYANSQDGDRGYFIMDGQPFLSLLDYTTMLADEVPLKSDPLYVGVLPNLDGGDEPPAWVSQDHELGRISFYDPNTTDLETITGFELNAAIE
jgi:DNA-binding beta-propeller fold protein YncE